MKHKDSAALGHLHARNPIWNVWLRKTAFNYWKEECEIWLAGKKQNKKNKGDPYNTSFEIPTLHLIITTSKSKNNQCGFFLSESLKWDRTRGGEKKKNGDRHIQRHEHLNNCVLVHSKMSICVLIRTLPHTHTHTLSNITPSLPPLDHRCQSSLGFLQ